MTFEIRPVGGVSKTSSLYPMIHLLPFPALADGVGCRYGLTRGVTHARIHAVVPCSLVFVDRSFTLMYRLLSSSFFTSLSFSVGGGGSFWSFLYTCRFILTQEYQATFFLWFWHFSAMGLFGHFLKLVNSIYFFSIVLPFRIHSKKNYGLTFVCFCLCPERLE